MADRQADLRGCAFAYDCRDRLPQLASWMNDEDLKLLPIWQGDRFEEGAVYFDLNNPDRGPFVGSRDMGNPSDHTYALRRDVPEKIWALLQTWRQPVSEAQGDAIEASMDQIGFDVERSAAGPARPIPSLPPLPRAPRKE